MTKARKYVAAAIVTGVAWTASHRGSLAQSLPPTPSVAYSGYLEDSGAPITGTRSVGLNIWTSNTTADVTNRVCQQAPVSTAVDTGWFTVALGSDCVAALRAYPALFLEFVVGSTTFPLQPIGAVPYALRALEYNSGSRLRRIVIQATDGAKQDDPTRWWDTMRQEECTFKNGGIATGTAKLCLPALLSGLTSGGCPGNGSFSDVTCTTSVAMPAEAVGADANGLVGGVVPKYVPSSTATSGLATASKAISIYSKDGCGGPCTPLTYYAAALDIDASAFVSATETHE
ncbi:MAG TPA: hypothetical protein VNW92_12045 [Polyangiaceae bacterium]|nr:hypothetical protein [Polyangiaceae bacterium]